MALPQPSARGRRPAGEQPCPAVSVLILNAGLGGSQGNSQIVAEHCCELLQAQGVKHECLVLRDAAPGDVPGALERAQRLVFVTGTYWGGFSSLLQQLFEELT